MCGFLDACLTVDLAKLTFSEIVSSEVFLLNLAC